MVVWLVLLSAEELDPDIRVECRVALNTVTAVEAQVVLVLSQFADLLQETRQLQPGQGWHAARVRVGFPAVELGLLAQDRLGGDAGQGIADAVCASESRLQQAVDQAQFGRRNIPLLVADQEKVARSTRLGGVTSQRFRLANRRGLPNSRPRTLKRLWP